MRPTLAEEQWAEPVAQDDGACGITYAVAMKAVIAAEARKRLDRLLDEIAVTREPVLITGRRGTAVLVSEEYWRALETTLYLLSIPRMAGSIRDGLKTPIEECVEELEW
jgi:prevent-host-death family protein